MQSIRIQKKGGHPIGCPPILGVGQIKTRVINHSPNKSPYSLTCNHTPLRWEHHLHIESCLRTTPTSWSNS